MRIEEPEASLEFETSWVWCRRHTSRGWSIRSFPARWPP